MEKIKKQQKRLAIFASGSRAAACLAVLRQSRLVSEILLIDNSRERGMASAFDDHRRLPVPHSAQIHRGNYWNCNAMDIEKHPGVIRSNPLVTSLEDFQQIVMHVVEHNPHAILIVASDPMEVLSYIAWKSSGLPPQQVIGTGTLLDTARFRYYLGNFFETAAANVQAFVLGEHNGLIVPVWSLISIEGIRINEYEGHTGKRLEMWSKNEITKKSRARSYTKVQPTDSSDYASMIAVGSLIKAIALNENKVLTVSSLAPAYFGLGEIFVSLPTVINNTGVARILPMPLSFQESLDLESAAYVIRNDIDSLMGRVSLKGKLIPDVLTCLN